MMVMNFIGAEDFQKDMVISHRKRLKHFVFKMANVNIVRLRLKMGT